MNHNKYNNLFKVMDINTADDGEKTLNIQIKCFEHLLPASLQMKVYRKLFSHVTV